jgi:hypothetical protein
LFCHGWVATGNHCTFFAAPRHTVLTHVNCRFLCAPQCRVVMCSRLHH